MTALILRATPSLEVVASKLLAFSFRLMRALDAFAADRARNAVPEWQMRKAQREMKRCRQLLVAGSKSPPRAAR
jgi:hypothetical protein